MNALTRDEADARMVGVEYFSPEEHLVDILCSATANQQDLFIGLKGVGSITLASSRGEYFCVIDDMHEFCTAPADHYDVIPLDARHSRLLEENIIGRNIDELLWQATFYASAGRLMEGCYRDDVVVLKYWPNLTRLPHTPNSMRIAALLSRHPTSIYFASRLLKVQPGEMYQFYSAARAAGFALPINRNGSEELTIKQHRNQSLLSALLNKIARL